jgi:putative FmdB family regulatory protein
VPNYEYRCTNCENQFEIWQEVGADAPPCPNCQSEVKKVFHPIRTIYKGSGFYVTDLRAEKEKSTPPTAGAAPTTETKSDSLKTESTKTKAESTASPASTPTANKAN